MWFKFALRQSLKNPFQILHLREKTAFLYIYPAADWLSPLCGRRPRSRSAAHTHGARDQRQLFATTTSCPADYAHARAAVAAEGFPPANRGSVTAAKAAKAALRHPSRYPEDDSLDSRCLARNEMYKKFIFAQNVLII